MRYLDDNGWLILIFAFIGTVFTGIGTAFWLVKRSHERKARQLLATGEVVEAEITGIGEDTSSSNERTSSYHGQLPLHRTGWTGCTSSAAVPSGMKATR